VNNQNNLIKKSFLYKSLYYFRIFPVKVLEILTGKAFSDIELQTLLKKSSDFNEVSLKLSDRFNHEFFLRNRQSDKGVVKQIFLEKCYEIRRCEQGREAHVFYDSLIDKGIAPLIIDAGANIGASIVWFANCFPSAKIIGIEPSSQNLKYALKNTASIPGNRIELLHAALASNGDEYLDLYDPSDEEWSYSTFSQNDEAVVVKTKEKVKTVDFKQLLDRQADACPYLLKIDIEGAEHSLFDTHQEYISKFYVIIIELHDYLYPWQQTSKSLLNFLAEYCYDTLLCGENLMCFKKFDL
jgi:FkbM family methyltransferase